MGNDPWAVTTRYVTTLLHSSKVTMLVYKVFHIYKLKELKVDNRY